MGNPPLKLQTVVDNSAMLNVGNANLSNISQGIITGPQAGLAGVSTQVAEQGIWTARQPDCLLPYAVTVTANVTANWIGGSNSAGSWTWQDLQGAFAGALWAVMQKISGPTGYKIYQSHATGPAGRGGCTPEELVGTGYYIPAGIQITAYNAAPEDTSQVAQVSLTYSTGDQSGGSACDIISSVGPLLAIFPEASLYALIVGIATTWECAALSLAT